MSREISRGTYTRPKTVLGFFGIVLLILVGGVVALSGVVGRYSLPHGLIWGALAFTAVIFVLILIEVFGHLRRDPTHLMLGEMSGQEFTDYQKMTMGDSLTGEVIETSPVQEPSGSRDARSLPQGEQESNGG